jgi:hypothetical protein
VLSEEEYEKMKEEEALALQVISLSPIMPFFLPPPGSVHDIFPACNFQSTIPFFNVQGVIPVHFPHTHGWIISTANSTSGW